MKSKSVKVIFDTNIWISFLIGKSLSKMKHHISDGSIIIIITEQLLQEIITVTKREKLRKYFPEENVNELLEFLEAIAENVKIKPLHFLSKDPKDNFLLDLIDLSKADYLVTGDKDLLDLNPFKTAQIITPFELENHLKDRRSNK